MLKAGYTAVGEFHYLHHQPDGTPYADPGEMAHRTVDAARRAGIAITLLPVFYMYGGFGAQRATPRQRRFVHTPERFLRLFEELGARWRASRDFRLGVAPHSTRAVTKETLEEVLAGIDGIDVTAPVHIHVAEQTGEVKECVAWSGMRPVAWLHANFPVDGRWCLVHATHVDRSELRTIAESGAVAGLCPTTEANLGDGIFPLRGFLRGGGRFAIGSDSQVSASPVDELRWLEYVQRLVSKRRNVTASPEERSVGRRLWNGALDGGTRALGMPHGGIRVGNRADFVALDADHPRLYGRQGDSLLDSFVFSGNDNPVRDVVVGGRHVVRDGHHDREDEIDLAWRRAVDALAPVNCPAAGAR